MNYEEFMEQYENEHYCCPKCKSRNFSSTLLGIIYNSQHPEEYKDINSVHCYTCGWKGIRHDLAPKPEKIGYKLAYSTGKDDDMRKNYSDIIYDASELDELKKMCKTLQEQLSDNFIYYYPVKID